MHGPAVPAAHPSHRAASSSSRHRLKPAAQVFASASANAWQKPKASAMHGPNPVVQPSLQYSRVVVWLVVALVVWLVVWLEVPDVVRDDVWLLVTELVTVVV